MNSKVFLKEVQNCFLKDKMTLFDSIQAIQEKYSIDFEDVVEYIKLEKTLMKDLKAEVIKNRLIKNLSLSNDINDFF